MQVTKRWGTTAMMMVLALAVLAPAASARQTLTRSRLAAVHEQAGVQLNRTLHRGAALNLNRAQRAAYLKRAYLAAHATERRLATHTRSIKSTCYGYFCPAANIVFCNQKVAAAAFCPRAAIGQFSNVHGNFSYVFSPGAHCSLLDATGAGPSRGTFLYDGAYSSCRADSSLADAPFGNGIQWNTPGIVEFAYTLNYSPEGRYMYGRTYSPYGGDAFSVDLATALAFDPYR